MIPAVPPSVDGPLPITEGTENAFHQGSATSWKVYTRIVLSGLLYGIGALFISAIFLFPELPPVIFLAGATLSVALAILIGCKASKASASNPGSKLIPKFVSKFIPGQPIKIEGRRVRLRPL